jgi:hypothetical protein
MSRILNILMYVLLAASAVIMGIFYFGPEVKVFGEEVPQITETALFYTYALFGAAAVLAVIFTIVNMIKNPKNAIKSLLSIGIVAIVVIIAYNAASGDVLNMPVYKGTHNVPTSLKWSGTGLITMYSFFGLAVLAIVFTEIAKYFRR